MLASSAWPILTMIPLIPKILLLQRKAHISLLVLAIRKQSSSDPTIAEIANSSLGDRFRRWSGRHD